MDTHYLSPYHNHHHNNERPVDLYPDDRGRHHHHHHHRNNSSHRSDSSSSSERRSDRASHDTDMELSDSSIRRSRSMVRHNPHPSPHRDHSPSPKPSHSRASSRSSHRHTPTIRAHSADPANRKRYEHAIEKAIGAGSAAAFHVRKADGSWAGAKGLKVVGAASAAAFIDYAFDKDPKHHKVRHVAMEMVRGSLVEAILHAGEGEKEHHDHGHGHDHHHHHRRGHRD